MIYYFNPDTEMALREGPSAFYIAPAPVRQMARDLSLLPLWLGGAEDKVLVEELPPSGFMAQLQALLPLGGLPAILTPGQLHQEPFTPWGWNPTLFAKLRQWGLSYPDEEAAAPLRYALGNKANLQLMDQELMRRGVQSADRRHFAIHSTAEAEELLKRHSQRFAHGFVLKEGYSSSGRGHRWCRPSAGDRPPQQLLNDELRGWMSRRFNRGEVIDLEPLYDKVADLALLFQLTPESEPHFSGYSLFETTPEGAYRSNLLASNEAILHHLSQFIAPSLIEEAKQAYLHLFKAQYACLSGPVGVDMMIYLDAERGTFTLHPDVEVNPRPTMGLIARHLCDRLLPPPRLCPDSLTGWRFVVEGSASSPDLQQRHATDLALHPLLRDAYGSPSGGYLPLTPVTNDTRFRAYLFR